ncbi:MAG: hypothetical protein UT32_C0023G0014 [Parcubacteria group bacterium GW2011_GWC2_39_14]|nr:MAG: hypothetical protein UT32_C0023G0014 [Parcubacteria group bacterium GW2011_GWC2_39_14]KKR53585.1 MAG: hypothetical protein UT91_C0025G0014 [Parcubacteria group bacterium GW2011_GWA2_40_23]
MSDVQIRINEMHKEIQVALKKRKDLAQVIKDAFLGRKEYQDLTEELNKLRARRKEIETGLRQEYSSEFNDLDDVKLDIKDMKTVLSDLMWNELLKNNSIEVVDEYENHYVPQVMVTLHKDK